MNRRAAEVAKKRSKKAWLMGEPSEYINGLATRVIGAAIEVHRHLGPGYLESTYEKALSIELSMQNVGHQVQAPVGLLYKGRCVGEGKLDLLVENELIVELKTVEKLVRIHRAQVISYLKATGKCLGLLINFNVPVLRDGVERIVLTKNKN